MVSLFPRTCSYYYCCYKYYYFGFLLKNPSVKLSCGHWVSSMASLHRGWLSGSNNLKNRVASKDKNNFFKALKSKQYTILCPSAMVKAVMESILIKSLTWSQIWQTLLWPVCQSHIQTFLTISPFPFWKPKWRPSSLASSCFYFYYHFIISIVVIGITVRNLCVIFTFWLWSVQIARLFFFELGGQIGYQAFQILMTFFFFCTDIAGGVERS